MGHQGIVIAGTNLSMNSHLVDFTSKLHLYFQV